jgi:hypothetical protein
MIRSYIYYAHGTGVATYSHKIWCDRRCGNYRDVVALKKNPRICEDIEIPLHWKIYNLGTLMERHICPSCDRLGLR